jgi:flagellar biosynthesis chaperone FliJ
MTAKAPIYPLKQVLDVKVRREDEARKLVEEKRLALEREEAKLKQLIEARDKVRRHYDDKLAQLRHELDTGTTSDKIQQAKAYLKIVQGNLEKEDKKVADQVTVVDGAKKALEDAQEELRQRRLEVEKIRIAKNGRRNRNER